MNALHGLPGVPESALAPEVDLSGEPPPAPWVCRVEAVVWAQRAYADCPAPGRRPSVPVTVGALVHYLDSPVGPYREVLVSPRVLLAAGLPRVHVPFIAVDSVASVHGGRALWGLPKALASFTGGATDAAARGDGWSVVTRTAARGPRWPLAALFGLEQGPGLARCSFRGRARWAWVDVRVTGPSLPGWVGDGRHIGLLVRGRLVVDAPR